MMRHITAKHLSSHGSQVNKPKLHPATYTCPQCNATFGTKFNLSRHQERTCGKATQRRIAQLTHKQYAQLCQRVSSLEERLSMLESKAKAL